MINDWREPWPRKASLGVGLVVGLYAAWIASGAEVVSTSFGPDVDQLWFAARAVLASRNPYELIGPGREFNYDWPLLYPMPAVLLSIVLTPFKVEVARTLMAALPSAALAYAIARTDPRGLVIFGSRAFFANAWYAQWTPLLMLMWWVPALAFLVVCKPTTGLAMLAGPIDSLRKGRVAIAVAVALLILSFVAQPNWFQHWLVAVRDADHVRPWVTLPFGWLLLLAAFRWRTWQGRFLLAFAVVPQTTHTLAVLPLLLLPGSLLQKAFVSALTHLPPFLLAREPFGTRMNEAAGHADRFAIHGEVLVWAVLIPVLLMVLTIKPGSANPEAKRK